MKIAFTCLFVFVLSSLQVSTSHAQVLANTVYDTTFHFNYFETIDAIEVVDDGDLIVVGKMEDDSTFARDIWIKRFRFEPDSTITTVWEMEFYPSNLARITRMIPLLDHNFLIAGSWNSNSMLLKIGHQGDSISTILVPSTVYQYFNDVIELPNSDLIALQLDKQDDLYCKIMRITSSGNIIWENEYDAKHYHTLQNYNADSFYVAGYEIHTNYQHILFGAYSTDGTTEFFSNFYQQHYGYNNRMANDTNMFYLGNSKEYATSGSHISGIIKFDNEGVEQWEIDYTDVGTSEIKDIIIKNSYLLTVSSYNGFLDNYYLVGAVTFDGVMESYFTSPIESPIVSGVRSFNQWLYVAGSYYTEDDSLGRDVFLDVYNIDSLWVISGQKEISVANNIKVYPNPVKDNLYINLGPEFSNEIVKIDILNSVGKIEKHFTSRGVQHTDLYVGDLPAGLYFVRINIQNKAIITKKVIVVR